LHILELEEYAGLLYAAGAFTKIGDTTASLLARWDGAAWQPLAEEMGGSGGSYVFDLENYDGYLYVGGYALSVGQNYYSPFRWDGVSWSKLSDQYYGVFSFAFDKDGVPYISIFDQILKLGENGWQQLGDSLPWQAWALTIGVDGTIYAGGYYVDELDEIFARVAKWDGAAWQLIAEENHASSVDALIADGTGDIYAAGDFTELGGVAANSIARWDGTAWHSVGSGIDGKVLELKIGNDRRLYAGGDFIAAGGKFSPNIAAYKLDELPDEGTPDDDAIIGTDDAVDEDTITSDSDNVGLPDSDNGEVPDDGGATPDEEETSKGSGCGCTVVME
jgi:hypothetical protein